MATSQNGWSVLRYASDPRMRDFPWVSGKVRRGATYTVMDYLARQFDDRVEDIVRSKSWGWAYRPIRGQSSGYSNHASATAVDFNAPDHWLGLRGTFTDAQEREIMKILSELEGVVRWGGTYQNRADEMHFEINAPASAVRRVAKKIKSGKDEDMSYEQWTNKGKNKFWQDFHAEFDKHMDDGINLHDERDNQFEGKSWRWVIKDTWRSLQSKGGGSGEG